MSPFDQKKFNEKFVHAITKNGNHEELSRELKDFTKLNAKKAISVYQEDYFARLTSALQNTYYRLHQLIGDYDFQVITNDYIKKYTSLSADLDDYGRELPIFLQHHPLLDEYPFLSSLADFEWNFRLLFHMSDDSGNGLNASELANYFEKQHWQVSLIKSVKLLHYPYKIIDLINTEEMNQFNYIQDQYLILCKKESLIQSYVLSLNQWEFLKKFEIPNFLLKELSDYQYAITPDEIQDLFAIIGDNKLLTSQYS